MGINEKLAAVHDTVLRVMTEAFDGLSPEGARAEKFDMVWGVQIVKERS